MENANFASRDAGSQSASKFTFTFKINITGSFNQIGFRTVFWDQLDWIKYPKKLLESSVLVKVFWRIKQELSKKITHHMVLC